MTAITVIIIRFNFLSLFEKQQEINGYMDWNSLSNTAIIQELGQRIKDTRHSKRLTQRQLADRAGISLFTVAQIERGKPVSIGMLVPVFRVLRLLDNFDLLVPEQQISPVELLKNNGRRPKRIRTNKQSE